MKISLIGLLCMLVLLGGCGKEEKITMMINDQVVASDSRIIIKDYQTPWIWSVWCYHGDID